MQEMSVCRSRKKMNSCDSLGFEFLYTLLGDINGGYSDLNLFRGRPVEYLRSLDNCFVKTLIPYVLTYLTKGEKAYGELLNFMSTFICLSLKIKK